MLSGNPTFASISSPTNIINVKPPLNSTMDQQNFKSYYPPVQYMPTQMLQVNHQAKDYKTYSQSFSSSNLPAYNIPVAQTPHIDDFLRVPRRSENVEQKNQVKLSPGKIHKFYPKSDIKKHIKQANSTQISQTNKKISEEVKVRVITKQPINEKANEHKKIYEDVQNSTFDRNKTQSFAGRHNKYRVSELPMKGNTFETQVSRTPGKQKVRINTLFATEIIKQSFGPTAKTIISPFKMAAQNLKPKENRKLNLSVTPVKVKRPGNSPYELKQGQKTQKPSFVPSKKSVTRFHIIGMIGSSKFSQAFRCMDKKTNSIYCLKKIKKSLINKSPNLLNQFIRKIGLQFRSIHPNVIQIYDVFCDSQFVYLVEEYMEGGSLRDFLNREKANKTSLNAIDEIKNQSSIVEKLFNINSALFYIHNAENKNEARIHGDLRPETILMSLGSCKISPINPIKIQKTVSLLHPYVCPQALVQQLLTATSDMWNLGLVLYQLCSKRSLFKVREFEHDMPLTDQIVSMQYEKQILNLQFITHALKDLIRNLLKIRPDQRLSSADVINSTVIKMYGLRSSEEHEAKRNKNDESQIEKFRREIKAHDNNFPKYLYNPTKHNIFYPRKSQEQGQ